MNVLNVVLALGLPSLFSTFTLLALYAYLTKNRTGLKTGYLMCLRIGMLLVLMVNMKAGYTSGVPIILPEAAAWRDSATWVYWLIIAIGFAYVFSIVATVVEIVVWFVRALLHKEPRNVPAMAE